MMKKTHAIPFAFAALSLLFLFGFAGSAHAAVAFVQSANSATSEYNYSSTGYTSITAQFGSNVTTGDMIAVVVEYGTDFPYYGGATSDDLVTGCSDSDNTSSTYHEAVDSVSGPNGQGVDIWYAADATGGTKPTVTCTFASGSDADYISMGILEYSGVATTSPLDTATFVDDSATSTNWAAGTSTTATAGELILGVFMDGSQSDPSFTAGSGYTMRVNQGTTASMMAEDEVQGSAGTVDPTATSSKSLAHQAAAMAAFRAAGTSVPSGIRWIQNASGHIANGTNPTATFINPVATGDTILVGLMDDDDSDTVTGCRDTYNATSSFHEAVTISTSTSASVLDIWYATNVNGGPNDTVVCTSVDSLYNKMITVSEYAGIAASSPLDATSSYIGAASSTTFTSGSATTHNNGDLIFGMLTTLSDDNTEILSSGSGYTIRANETGSAAEDMLQTSAGSVSATATDSGSYRYLGVLAAFEPTGSASPAGPAPYTEVLPFGW